MSVTESPVKKRRKQKEDNGDGLRECVIHVVNVGPQEAFAKFTEKAWMVSRSYATI